MLYNHIQICHDPSYRATGVAMKVFKQGAQRKKRRISTKREAISSLDEEELHFLFLSEIQFAAWSSAEATRAFGEL
jgi:hypothetical protein